MIGGQPLLQSNQRRGPLPYLSTQTCRVSFRPIADITNRHTVTAIGNEGGLLFVSDRRAGGADKRDNFAAAKSCFLAPFGELRPREVESLTKLNEHVQGHH